MKPLRLYKTIMGLSFLVVAISSLLTACSDVEDVGDIRFINSYCLRFLDGPEFEEGRQEVLRVTSSAQTIELKVKEVNDPEAPVPTDLSVKVEEWNEQAKRYYEISGFHQQSDYYKVYTKKENDETIIYIEFSENVTNNERILQLYIFSDLVYRGVNNIIFNPMGTIQIIQQPNVEETRLSAVKAKYKGRLYTSEVVVDQAGKMSFLDPDYSSLMQKLDSLENVQMLIIDDSTVYYYDKEDIDVNQPYNDISSLQPPSVHTLNSYTRANGFEYDDPSYLGYFAIYDNDHFGGSYISKGLTNFHFTHNLPNLKSYSMNDKVTSIAVGYNSDNPIMCSVLTIWDDTDFNYGDDNRSKHRISIIASRNSTRTSVPDLKKIKKIGSSKSWNDCISSISFHFGYIDRLLLDY